ncbi:MAG: cupin domain-containing protein [Acidimicrobiales bacterium]|nr:cupin domain-containing protein [Acidimicrobiales bacterium]
MEHISFADIGWHVPVGSRADLDLATESPPDRPGRKFLVDGTAGFYTQMVRLPPGFEAPSHRHDHAEVFMVLEGSCAFNGTAMVAYDTVVVDADESYGFVAGPDGVHFLVTRQAIASFTEDA